MKCKGFNLLEVNLTIFMITIIYLWLFSHLNNIVNTFNLKLQGYKLKNIIVFARSQAITKQHKVQICYSLNNKNCANKSFFNKTNWNNNIMVFIDKNQNWLKDINENIILTYVVPDNIKIIWNRGGALAFNQIGFTSGKAGSFLICKENLTKSYKITLNIYGRSNLNTNTSKDFQCD